MGNEAATSATVPRKKAGTVMLLRVLTSECARSDAAASARVSPGLETNRLAATGREFQLQRVAATNLATLDRDRERMPAPIGIRAVAIDVRAVAAIRIEEIELHLERARVLVRNAAEIPVVAV